MTTLKAETRSMAIKAKRLRREGYVTGNLFGKELKESIPVKIEKNAAERFLKTAVKGTQLMLEVDGTPYDVLIKDIVYNPMKNEYQEIDFQALVKGEKVHSVAEIILINHDKVIGGVLQQQLEEVSFRALPSALVDKVRVDVSSLHVGDTLKVKDLELAANPDIDLQTDPEAIIATVTAVHLSTSDEAALEEAEEKDSKK